MTDFKDRFQLLVDESQKSATELSRELNVSKQTISAWCTGARSPRRPLIEHIARHFGVSIPWLMGISDERRAPAPTKVSIPVLGSIRAGLPQTAAENIIDYEEIPAEMERDGEYFALQIRGDSMEPRMRTGDVIIVRKQEQVDNGDVAVVLINGDEATVKRYYRRESGVSLVAINPAYEPLFYTPEQVEELPVRVMGKVVELRAKF